MTGAGLTLDDGTRVTVTVGGGHFIAWWPGSEGVATSTETTASGSQSGPADVATLRGDQSRGLRGRFRRNPAARNGRCRSPDRIGREPCSGPARRISGRDAL